MIVDLTDVTRMEHYLEAFNKRALPHATRNTVNTAAFQARGFAQENIRENMTTRNKFTERSVRVEQTKSLDISKQESTVGSVAGYLADQEFGATKHKTGSEGVAIATSYSAGQGENTQPRTRLPRRPNKLANIQLQRRRKKGGSRKQQNLMAIRQAATTGRKYLFLDLGRSKGIFRVVGGRRRPKIKMVHDMSRESVVIPKNPWLEPAQERVDVEEIHKKSLAFQVKRMRLFI